MSFDMQSHGAPQPKKKAATTTTTTIKQKMINHFLPSIFIGSHIVLTN
jgi:hypothetical protein